MQLPALQIVILEVAYFAESNKMLLTVLSQCYYLLHLSDCLEHLGQKVEELLYRHQFE